MTIAQTKAARRKFRTYYKDGPIGQPRYKMKSTDKLARREREVREKMKLMAARRGAKGK